MSNDQKNLFAAMGLSLLVIVAWQYFFAVPEAQRVQQQKDRAQQAQNLPKPGAPPATGAKPGPQTPSAPATTPGAPGAAKPGAVSAPPKSALSREQAIASSPSVKIDTPSISGSIDLKGARLNNVELKKYRKTIKKDSGRIELLSPANAPNPYYVQTGFVSQDSKLKLPQPDTVWKSNDSTLSPGKPVTLTWDNGQGLVFKRTVSVDENYLFTFKDSVQNNTASAVTLFPYALVARVGQPKTEGFYVLHEGLVGVVGDSKVQEISYSGILKEANNQRLLKGKGGWIGITDKYWSTAVIPDQNVEFQGRFAAYPGGRATFQTDVLGPATVVQPKGTAETSHLVFAGAKESGIIDAYQAKYNIKNFDLMIDWGWFYFITKPLFKAIDFIYRYVGNFGVAILLITVLIKLLFFPLANRSYESMAKMKAVQPEMKALQERYANDKQTMQKELMALYKREKINPVAGCWPVLLQIPVFFALYKVIFITIEMRHAPFIGWIQDLSAPDPTNIFNLFGLLPFDPTQIPLMGPFLWVGIWPLLMGVSMFVQMKMNPEPTDPVQKTMFAWMPVIFTFMLGAFPAGLVIYWTWNNILSVAQQYYIMKKQGVKVELWDNLANMFKKKTA